MIVTTTGEPIVLERVLKAMRKQLRPVTAAELIFVAGLAKIDSIRATRALETLRELGIVTRAERVEPRAYGSRLTVTRVYYAVVSQEAARG
jgi:hypothetical protein